MNMKKRTPMEVLFNDRARSILYGLVYRKNLIGLGSPQDALFEPTISAIFCLYSEILEKNTPDLYDFEWKLIVKSLRPDRGIYQMPDNIKDVKDQLVMLLEDMVDDETATVNNLELSFKIAGLSDLNLCSIYYHAQKCVVASHRNEPYQFPKIKFKG